MTYLSAYNEANWCEEVGMDENFGSTLVELAKDILGVLLLGAMVIYGFFILAWVYWLPLFEEIGTLDKPAIGGIIAASIIVAGYATQGIGFPIFSGIFKACGYDPARNLLTDEYKSRIWKRLCGCPDNFSPEFLALLTVAINDHFGDLFLLANKKNHEDAFRLCWRTVGIHYHAVSESSYTAFGNRNLNLNCFLGTLFLTIVFLSTKSFPGFAVAAIASVAFLRQFVYYEGEWARNVYHCFYAWYRQTKALTGAGQGLTGSTTTSLLGTPPSPAGDKSSASTRTNRQSSH